MNPPAPQPPVHWLSLIVAGASAFAAAPAAVAAWTGSVDGGTSVQDGRTTVRLRAFADQNTRPLTQHLSAEWIRSDRPDHAVLATWKPRWWFAKRWYGFGELRARRDDALAIDRQWRVLLGGGAVLQSAPEAALQLEAGVGIVDTRLDDRAFDAADDDPGYIGVVRATGYRALLERVQVDGALALERSASATEWRIDAGVGLRLAAGTLRYGVQARGLAPDEGSSVRETDTFVSFGYRF